MEARLLVGALLVVALAGCTDGASETAGDGPTGRIDGAVLDHVMMPFRNVSVHLVEQDAWARTTDLGGFSFLDVPVGFHTLEVFVEGRGFDREMVAVDEGETSKIILQIVPEPGHDPHITVLSDSAVVQIAMPGEECGDCAWRAGLRDHRPELVVAHVTWQGRHPLSSDMETHLVVELRDQDGTLLLGPLGRDDVVREGGMFTLGGTVAGADIARTAGNLALHFTFDEDNMPHPDFQMQSRLDMHYGQTTEVRAQSGD